MSETATSQLTAVPLDQLVEAEDNPRRINDEAFDRLCYSLEADPAMLVPRPTIRDARPGRGDVVAGNMRIRAAAHVLREKPDGNLAAFLERHGGMPTYDKVFANDAERREWMLRDNQGYGEYVPEELAQLLAQHRSEDADLALLGFAAGEVEDLLALAIDGSDEGAGGGGGPAGVGSLAERFGLPPFSVLDARRGEWRDRKRGWLEGYRIKSELGREQLADQHSARSSEHVQDPRFYESKREVEQQLGRELTSAEFIRDHWTDSRGTQEGGLAAAEASVFDPVVCELAYRWFCPEGGLVVDPFAGGSVRGIVAAAMGRQYVGVDLRDEQVQANREQMAALESTVEQSITGGASWHTGDARDVYRIVDAEADLVFSCPPYHDLEVYSDDPRDLSRCGSYDEFRRAHAQVIKDAVALMSDDRFAVWVIGDVRDKKGRQLPLVADTIRAFEDAGAAFYNEAILVQPIGSLRIRVARQFVASRKLGRTHQQMLVFVKGDPKKATAACEAVDADLVEQDVDTVADLEVPDADTV